MSADLISVRAVIAPFAARTALIAALAIAAIQPATAGSFRAPQIGDKIQAGSGGPFVAVGSDTVDAPGGDDRFHALFLSWKKLDSAKSQGAISVPSAKPVSAATFTSSFGVRSDPFRGSAAMHAGIDLAAPVGTAIYATADGMVDRAEWSGGYGNMVEIDHGKGLETRFGHLSRILVRPGQQVKRGQLIALMGSTGRSTGSHLHYEVRIDGRAVNPMPFLQTSDYVVAMQQRSDAGLAQGGPDDVD